MNATLPQVIRRWARIGAGFDVEPATQTPDLEQLLVDSARTAHEEARLLPVVGAWLVQYPELVASQRLANLVSAGLEAESRPVLGLLLDSVRERRRTGHFNEAIGLCSRAATPGPLYDFQRASPRLAELAKSRASKLGRRWGVWVEPFEPKPEAIRPIRWVLARNPSFELRLRFEGDLRATIVETLRANPAAGRSELELARQCRASRDALRKALDRLSRYEYIERQREKRSLSVTLAA